MEKIMKISKTLFIMILCFSLFGLTNVYAEEVTPISDREYTITIDPNGGIPGPEFKDKIVLLEDENYPVGGANENFLKAPEGKGFAGIEIINKDGEVEGIADGVLLWGADFCDGETLRFHWGEIVNNVEITLENPEIGSETTTPMNEYGYYETDSQTNKPKVTVNPDYGMEIQYLEWVEKDSYNEENDYFEDPFIGTFEIGQKYYALVDLYCNSLEYSLSDSLNITIKGASANIYKIMSYSTGASIVLEIELEDPTTYTVIEGANQEVQVGEEAEFEIDADYSLFKDGGEVYVDDTLIEEEKDYTSKAGSTIITLTEDYINTLSEGTHTLKVVFNDDKTATTLFNIVNANSNIEIIPPHTGIKTLDKKESTLFYSLLATILGLIGISLITKKQTN